MSAQAGYRFIYSRVVGDLDEVGRLKVDATLDLPGAKAALQRHYQSGFDQLAAIQDGA